MPRVIDDPIPPLILFGLILLTVCFAPVPIQLVAGNDIRRRCFAIYFNQHSV
jgi:hypothetical protein